MEVAGIEDIVTETIHRIGLARRRRTRHAVLALHFTANMIRDVRVAAEGRIQ